MNRKPWKGCLVLGSVLAAGTVWSAELPQDPVPNRYQVVQQTPAGQTQTPAGQQKSAPAQKAAPSSQTPAQPGTTTLPPSTPPLTSPQNQSALAAASTGASSLSNNNEFSRSVEYRMLGDLAPLPVAAVAFGQPTGQTLNGLQRGGVLVPSVRGVKIADNENPEPQDRLYFNFNYYNDLNGPVNDALGIDVHNIQAFRYTFGLEKTFFDGWASIGFRLPLNNLSTESGFAAYDGSSTDIGNLTIILKDLLYRSEDKRDVLSGGIAVTVPSGPDSFAGSPFIVPNTTVLQPFVGYRKGWDNFFIHGFIAIDVPMTTTDVTMLYNDVGIGYFLLKTEPQSTQFITGIVPTLECHINDPLNHRRPFDVNDLVGVADSVILTTGVTFEMNHRSFLAVGLAVPVTGPKPFSTEAIAQFNYRFGAGLPSTQPQANVLQ